MSPARNYWGGRMPSPAPSGVPVLMMSPGQQGHELTDVADQFGDTEDHVGRAAFLPGLAIDL
jgi:hypothetical protein